MRWLVALLFLPMVAAEPVEILSDPADDLELATSGTSIVSAPGLLAPQGDILALHLEETSGLLIFTLQLSGLQSGAAATTFHRIQFVFQEQEYEIGFQFIAGLDQSWTTFLRQLDPGTGVWESIWADAALVDEQTGTLAIEIPRRLFIDADGATPRPGHSLSDFRMEGETNGLIYIEQDEPAIVLRDRVEPEPAPSYDIRIGVPQDGNARLGSHAPFRFSNGEATTLVFKVTATNLGETDRFSFEASDVPSGWDVILPGSELQIQGDSAVTIPVLVAVPFAHAHGTIQSFMLEMQSSSDASTIGRIELGVQYPEIAQPAGHHDQLWFHGHERELNLITTIFGAAVDLLTGAGTFDYVTMNTQDDGGGIPVKGNTCGFNPNTTTGFGANYCWRIALSPGLAMGLRMNPEVIGSLEIPIGSLLGTDATLTGELRWLGPVDRNSREEAVMAQLRNAGPVTIPPNGVATFTADVVPGPSMQQPFLPGAALVLDLQLAVARDGISVGPQADKPELHPGGFMFAPLLEYHDPVDEAFAASEVRLQADTVERRANPGTSVLFEANVTNAGAAGDFQVALIGDRQGWATLLGPSKFRLATNETRAIQVALEVPQAAADGDVMDFVLEVAATDRIDQRALLRLLIEVDDDAEHADDRARIDGHNATTKNSPGIPIVPLLVGLVLLVRRR